MIGWLTHLQHARGKNVIFVAILERVVDEFNRAEWAIQIEGQKTGRELPGIVDQIVTMNFVDFGDGKPPTRAFICTPNLWGYPPGPLRTARTDRAAASRQTDREANRPRPAQAVLSFTPEQTLKQKVERRKQMPDFNDAGPQRSFDVIPDGTIATVRMKIRPGNAGEGGWLRRSKDGNSEALDCEFVVLDGEFAKRKFWTLLTVGGATDGHEEAGDISSARIRAMLESARGIRPDDNVRRCEAARQTTSTATSTALCFMPHRRRAGAKRLQGEKHRLDRVITPDADAPGTRSTQDPKPAASPTAAASTNAPAKIERPTWAS